MNVPGARPHSLNDAAKAQLQWSDGEMHRGHVYLIDDEPSRREGLAQVLQQQDYALQTFAHGPAFLDWVDYDRLPESACVVTHLSLEPMSGVELLDVFRADRVLLPAVLIGSARDLQLAVKAVRYGGTYILWRPFAAALLVEVVASMLHEWRSAPSSAVESGPQATIEDRFATLSRRQRQVLRYVFEGNGNRAIAGALGISVKTVELHRACMMKKMHADSVVALVRMMSDLHRSLERCA